MLIQWAKFNLTVMCRSQSKMAAILIFYFRWSTFLFAVRCSNTFRFVFVLMSFISLRLTRIVLMASSERVYFYYFTSHTHRLGILHTALLHSNSRALDCSWKLQTTKPLSIDTAFLISHFCGILVTHWNPSINSYVYIAIIKCSFH